ncbi:zinc finger, CCHC-type, Retrotransposon gag domain protein [Artemisia annua]|uniref:Zinc finger, CCHC-type, Retrotransposon gag domain protein n=1 Tax=Artemisia annua TaxID=35608 RepID=A0A2U1QLC1_ARTAN|nr:zinc finger, CCHC-type, Retrotransposon gag domain protein [Artemisia annua]
MVATRRNGEGDAPDFKAMINAALANALPNLSTELRTQIYNDIRNGAAEDWITHMEMVFKVLGCPDNFKTRLAAFKLEGDALSWWTAHLRTQAGGEAYADTCTWATFREIFYNRYFPVSEQQRFEREYGSIYQLERENSVEYMQRFMRLVSFVGPVAGDALRQARHFKWGLKRWVLDRIVNAEYPDVAQVCAAARNIELLHESGPSNKRDRDGNRVQHRGHGNQEYRGRSDQGYQGNNNRQWKDQAARGNQQGRHSGSSSQQKPVEALPPPPICTTCGKAHPGPCFKATGGCFVCGSTTHKIKDCPKRNSMVPGNYNKPPPTSGRVYSTTREQAERTSGPYGICSFHSIQRMSSCLELISTRTYIRRPYGICSFHSIQRMSSCLELISTRTYIRLILTGFNLSTSSSKCHQQQVRRGSPTTSISNETNNSFSSTLYFVEQDYEEYRRKIFLESVNKAKINKPIVEALQKETKCLRAPEDELTSKSKIEELSHVSWSLCEYHRKIYIESCDVLSSVIPWYAVGQMQKLQVLEIRGGELMMEVFETQEMHNKSVTHTRNSLPRPEYVMMLKLPKLKILKIQGCNLLEHIFTYSTLESLTQLEELEIMDCEAMEVIEKKDNGEQTTTSDMVVFPHLKSLSLVDLPNVVGFFLGRSEFIWPASIGKGCDR